MGLILEVDANRWRSGVRAHAEREPGVVPVIKGNGYGFGFDRLLVEPTADNWPLIAVGSYAEAARALGVTRSQVLVLTPWRPGDATAEVALASDRVIHTLSRVEDVAPFATAVDRHGATRADVVIEVRTSMRRFGVLQIELPQTASALAGAGDTVRCSGLALHHPLARRGADPLAETIAAARDARDLMPSSVETVYVSHLAADELRKVRTAVPEIAIRPRVGTTLWLGDRQAWRARATVLDVHRVARGERIGYWQRRVPGDGHVLVVSGGTSNGIAMEAPPAPRGASARVRSVAIAGLTAGGLALSPYSWAGRKRWFAEPPHMQISLLYLPGAITPPDVGMELSVEVRLTTVTFDEVRYVDRGP